MAPLEKQKDRSAVSFACCRKRRTTRKTEQRGVAAVLTLLLVTMLPLHNHAVCPSSILNDSESSSTTCLSDCVLSGHRSKATRTALQTNKIELTMSKQPALAARMELLCPSNNDFTMRFVQEIKNQDEAKERRAVSDMKQTVWLTTGAAVLALSASFFVLPALLPSRLNIAQLKLTTATSSLVTLLPFTTTSSALRRQVEILVLDAMALAQLLARDQAVWHYVRDKLVPSAWSMLQKMLWMEFWRRVWRVVNAQIHNLVKRRRGTTKDEALLQQALPSWMFKVHVFFQDMVRRGTLSFAKRSIQRKVHVVLVAMVDAALLYAKRGAQALLFPAQEGAAIAASH